MLKKLIYRKTLQRCASAFTGKVRNRRTKSFYGSLRHKRHNLRLNRPKSKYQTSQI